MASSSQKPLHVVVGASGPLGTWIVRELLKRGDVRVRAVSRSGGGDHGKMVEYASADASNVDSLVAACEGADVIYHAMNTLYTTWPKTLEPIMLGMIEAAEKTGAKLVYADNVYCYGDAGEPLHEELPWAAKTKKGRIRKRLLDLLFRAHNERRIRATAGMAADFYGPEVLSSFIGEYMVPRILQGKAGLFVGNPDLLNSYAYIEDFARDLVTIALDKRADGERWHTTHAPARTTRQMTEIMASVLGRPVRIQSMSMFLLRLVGFVFQQFHQLHCHYKLLNMLI